MFVGARTFLKIQTRRPRERPKTLPVIVKTKEGAEEWRQLPIEDLPFYLRMWHLTKPPILEGVETLDGAMLGHPYWTDYWSPDAVHKLSKDDMKLLTHFSPDQLCLMLGKIGHSFAVAELGYTFSPLLSGFIREGSALIGSYIGGCGSPPYKPGRLNHIAIRKREDSYISVEIQLFSFLNTPTYEIIVGKPLAKGSQN